MDVTKEKRKYGCDTDDWPPLLSVTKPNQRKGLTHQVSMVSLHRKKGFSDETRRRLKEKRTLNGGMMTGNPFFRPPNQHKRRGCESAVCSGLIRKQSERRCRGFFTAKEGVRCV